jgi:DNA ligase (NAD+)
MYSDLQTKKLQKSSLDLLKSVRNGKFDIADIETLKDVLRFHEYRYYIENDPLISDTEYDTLFKQLEISEKERPDLITEDSPTQRVATVMTGDFPSVQHLVPMLSLENSYNEQDLIDWDRRAREALKLDSIEYCAEPKFDGASISLIYENNRLIRGATRGNGVQGDDITPNIRQVRSVPLSADFLQYDIQMIEIRGEVMLTKSNFKAYNDKLAESNLPPLANPRNAAAGSLRIKDAAEVRRRNLEAFLYHVSYFLIRDGKPVPVELTTHSGSLALLRKTGFRSPEKEKKVVKGIDAVISFCREYELNRDNLPYEIDGMVIKVNDIELQEKLGMTTHHPRWAIAFKFKARQATSKLRAVEFQVGRTGSVTPVAKIDPVPIGGVTVGSISLFNEDVIREKDLMIGDSVLVERAGDVIPYIVKSLADVRNGNEQPIIFPVNCPVCGDPLVKTPGEAVLRCNNINCPAQVIERIIHFTSKDAMDIRGFGDANIRKFYELNFLNSIPGIYHLPYEKISTLEGFGPKSISNLKAAIEKSKEQPLHRLIYGLGIRYVGETTAKVLAHSVANVLDLASISEDELKELEDIGPKVASSVYQFFHNADNIEMLTQLGQSGVQLKNTQRQSASGGSLAGLTFLFTGTLPTLKRTEAEGMVEASGGKLLTGVSSKLNYLVVGEDAGSKLEKAKKISTVRILNEKQFLELLESSKQ